MNLLVAIIGALAAGIATVFLRHSKIGDVGGAVILSIIVAAGMLGATAFITETIPALKQPTVAYVLETGEYLHCTPQGGDNLACIIEHREDNQ